MSGQMGSGRSHAVFTVRRGEGRETRGGDGGGGNGVEARSLAHQKRNLHIFHAEQAWTSAASALCHSQPPEWGPMCLGKVRQGPIYSSL